MAGQCPVKILVGLEKRMTNRWGIPRIHERRRGDRVCLRLRVRVRERRAEHQGGGDRHSVIASELVQILNPDFWLLNTALAEPTKEVLQALHVSLAIPPASVRLNLHRRLGTVVYPICFQRLRVTAREAEPLRGGMERPRFRGRKEPATGRHLPVVFDRNVDKQPDTIGSLDPLSPKHCLLHAQNRLASTPGFDYQHIVSHLKGFPIDIVYIVCSATIRCRSHEFSTV